MEIVQCRQNDDVVIGRMCIVTHRAEKLAVNEYETHFVSWKLNCT